MNAFVTTHKIIGEKNKHKKHPFKGQWHKSAQHLKGTLTKECAIFADFRQARRAWEELYHSHFPHLCRLSQSGSFCPSQWESTVECLERCYWWRQLTFCPSQWERTVECLERCYWWRQIQLTFCPSQWESIAGCLVRCYWWRHLTPTFQCRTLAIHSSLFYKIISCYLL